MYSVFSFSYRVERRERHFIPVPMAHILLRCYSGRNFLTCRRLSAITVLNREPHRNKQRDTRVSSPL